MANYNHEVLVNYLRDVYSMELLVRKIEDDVHSTGEDVEYLQTLIEKADSTPVPQKGTISPPKDIFPSLAKGCVTLGILICLLLFSPDSGFLGLIAALCLYLSLGFFIYAGFIASNNAKKQKMEKEAVEETYQEEKKDYERMMALANEGRPDLPNQIDDYNAAVSHLQEAKEKLQSVYSVNIIPNKYRSVYVAYYLYDYISSSHETDVDRVLQTMLLEQIIAKLDKIIAQQEEIILNQRMQLAKQDALLAQSKKQHEEQMKAISNLEENQQMQNDYLAMTEANTRITNYFVTADYINKYI
jgi:hypothetical protein